MDHLNQELISMRAIRGEVSNLALICHHRSFVVGTNGTGADPASPSEPAPKSVEIDCGHPRPKMEQRIATSPLLVPAVKKSEMEKK